MLNFERRLLKIEEHYAPDDLSDVRDVKEVSTHALARYLLACLPPNYMDALTDPDWAFLRNFLDERSLMGMSDEQLKEPLDRYVAMQLTDAVPPRGDPLYIERYRGRFPDRILAAAYNHVRNNSLLKTCTGVSGNSRGAVEVQMHEGRDTHGT